MSAFVATAQGRVSRVGHKTQPWNRRSGHPRRLSSQWGLGESLEGHRVIGMRRVGHAGIVCALPILALLVPQAAYATTNLAGGAISVPGASSPAKPAPAVPGSTRFVSYNGVRVTVPAAWPVIDLRLHPSACVRLDQAALYLGSPGPQSDCPAHAVGRADTIWLHTAPAEQQAPSTSQVATVGGLAARVGTDPTSHDKQTQFVTQGVELDATWGADSSPIDQVLASAVTSSGSSTSTPAAASPSTTATAPSSAAVAAPQPASPPPPPPRPGAAPSTPAPASPSTTATAPSSAAVAAPQPASPAAATPAAVTAAITSGAH